MADQLHDSHDAPAYVYTPLQKEHDEIRILVLEPAWDHESPIHVSFEVLNRSQRSSYEALSYTWGDPNLTHRVFVHQIYQISITKNLDEVLRKLRRKGEKKHLWIDALCINQSDDKEKSSQIPQMHSIYHNASNVVAWLGAGGKAEAAGMRLLQDISRWPRDKVVDIETTKKYRYFHYTQEANIAALLSLPWFTRMWIIQEIVFNIDVRLMCGSEEISWARFITALELCQKIYRWSTTHMDELNNKLMEIAAISSLWKQHSMFVNSDYRSRGVQILGMLQTFAQYQCSDPRDRIFSLYNMATDLKNSLSNGEHFFKAPLEKNEVIETLIEFDVDYTLDVRETFYSFALACAGAGKIDQLLQAVIDRNTFPDLTHWPSWVPDWRSTPIPGRQRLSLTSLPMLRYVRHDPHGILLQSLRCISNTAQDPVQGNFVDIDYIGPTITTADSNDSITCKISRFYDILSDVFPFFRAQGAVFFIDTLASILRLSSDATKILKGHLLGYIPFVDPAYVASRWPKPPSLSEIIVSAMEGKKWFRASIPDRGIFLCGIANTSIEPGDELLVANDAEKFGGSTARNGFIVRCTSTTQRAVSRWPLGASSRYSYRIISGASISWAILDRFQPYDTGRVYREMLDKVRKDLMYRQQPAFYFWLD